MKSHRYTERLIEYLREHPQPMSAAGVVMAGVMNSLDASYAIRYGVRHGVIERIKRPGARANERVQYRLTGQPLPPARKGGAVPSFDALLTAWGIARVPPQLPGEVSARMVSLD
jgi:hypothetical protein